MYLNFTMFQGLILVTLDLVDILPGRSRALKYGQVKRCWACRGTCNNVIV